MRSSLAARDGPFCRRRACAHLGLTRRVVGPRRTPRPLGPRAGGSDPRPSASRRHGRVAASSFLSPRESSAPRVRTQAAGSCRASEPTRDTRLAPPFLRGARATSSLPGASSPRVVLDAHAERHPSVRHRLGVKPTPRPPADLQHLPETVPGVTPSGRNSRHGDPSGRSAAFHTCPVSASSPEASVIATSCKDGLLLLAFDARLCVIKRCLEVILIPSVQPPNTAWLKGLRNLNAIYPLMPSKVWLPVGPHAKDSRGPRPRFPTLFPAEGSRGPLEKRPMASLGQGRAGVPMLCPRARQWTQDQPGGSHWPNAGK